MLCEIPRLPASRNGRRKTGFASATSAQNAKFAGTYYGDDDDDAAAADAD